MKKSFFTILLLCTIFSGCSNRTELICLDHYFTPEPNNLEIAPIVNDGFTIELDERLGPYTIGDALWFHLENHSKDRIVITLDQQLLILMSAGDDKFDSIHNNLNYSSTPSMILEPKNSDYSSAQILIKPELSNQDETVELLILIWGNLWENDKFCNQLYSAQTTVLLEPD